MNYKNVGPLFAALRAGDKVGIARSIRALHGRRYTTAGPPKSVEARFFEKVCFGPGQCWYWIASIGAGGYGSFLAMDEVKAHRVSYRIHHGAIPEGMMVLHRCDNPPCVNPDHLFLGTQFDNMRDMSAKKRGVNTPQHGEDNPMSRLTKESVRWIRSLYATGERSMKSLAADYGVTTATVWRAIHNKSWRSE